MKIGSSLFAKPMMSGNPVPIGTYSQQFINTPNPNGYIPCDGRAISRIAYPTLFGMFSTYFGIGDGSTTFNLPDFNTGAVDTITYVKALDVVTGFVTDANTLGGQIPDFYTGKGMKNKIINGNFDIWQRGTSLAASGSMGNYLADRWISSSGGTTVAPSQQLFGLGQTIVPNNPTYFSRSVVASVTANVNYSMISQKIEYAKTLSGRVATLSFWAKADSNKSIAVEFTQNFGTGGSPTASVYSIGVTVVALTTIWTKYVITLAIPSVSGATLGSSANDALCINFWFDAGNSYTSRTGSLGQQSGTFDIAQVQLEEGNIATYFEQRHISQELALCQRYYEKSYDMLKYAGAVATLGGCSCYFNTGNSVAGQKGSSFQFKQIKRTSPTLIVYDRNGAANCGSLISADGSSWTHGAPITYLSFINGVITYYTTTAGGYSFEYTADAEL